MSQIDFSKLMSAEAIRQKQQHARAAAIKATCRARILAVVDQTRQMNLTAAAAAGLMEPDQHRAWLAALGWIELMRQTCAQYIRQAQVDDVEALEWPQVPGEISQIQTGPA